MFSVVIIFIISYFSQEILFRWIITLIYFTNTRCWSVWRKRRAILALVVVRGFSTLNCKTWLIAPQITLSSPLANPWSDSTVSSTKNLRHSHVSRYFSNQIILYKSQCSSSCRISDCLLSCYVERVVPVLALANWSYQLSVLISFLAMQSFPAAYIFIVFSFWSCTS